MIDDLLKKGLLPDPVIRKGINTLLGQRLKEEKGHGVEHADRKRQALIEELKKSPIAVETDAANDQHYQVPTEFYLYCLGPHLKYSCCLFEPGDTLAQAEERMLELTCERADLKDGQDILELGCGWGSLSLFMAKKYPNSKIIAISNSNTQREFITKRAQERGLNNLEIRTHNVAHLELEERFDRVVSVEMFEHMRNYGMLLKNISNWLKDNGKLFVHIFVHREWPYKFEVKDQTDWMSKYFFSGGTMPSEYLLYHFQEDLNITKHWRVDGEHYARTSEEWLRNMDSNKRVIMDVFTKHYGKEKARQWFHYWRVFYMSCTEIWRFNKGEEWFVCHYLFEKK